MNQKTTPPQRQILTDEIKEKVNARVKELLAKAADLWPEHKEQFDVMPVVRFDIKSKLGGLAYSGGTLDWTIRLNVILCYENEDHFIQQTVGHEVAHLIQRKVYGFTKTVIINEKPVTKKVMSHGVEWKHVMSELGLAVEKFHYYSLKSIEQPKRKRQKRGTIITDPLKLEKMLKSIKNSYHRLPDEAKKEFASWVVEVDQII